MGSDMTKFDDHQEALRLAALKRYDILDTPPEPAFDRLTKLAAEIFDIPIAAIVFPIMGRLWLKSKFGFDLPACEHSIRASRQHIENTKPFFIQDTRVDPEFRDHPLVVSGPQIRSYASAPLITPEGQSIGSLLIADTKLRATIPDTKLTWLQDLAYLVVDELELKRERARSLRDREARSAFFADLSHDLRTPMNGVLGMAELLLTADDIDDRHRRRIEIIHRSGETLLERLDQFIDRSKSESDELELMTVGFNLLALVQDVQTTFEPKAQSKGLGLNLSQTIDADHDFMGDPSRLTKIVSHILNHMVAATDEGPLSFRVISTPCSPECTHLRFDVQAPGRHENTELSPEEDALSANRKSTVIDQSDLAMALELASPIDAQIGIQKLPNGGTSAWLEVELRNQVERKTADSTVENTGGERNAASMSRNILIAEDDADMALLIEELIRDAGHHPSIAPDGASVLRMLDQHDFDLVLMDGRMPDMSGFEATSRIRDLPDERSQIPIIALTGEALVGDRERYLAAGMDDYVAKPVNYDLLVATIERCCQ